MERCREWLYIAAQPSGVLFGPTKIGWTGRRELGSRIDEHSRSHRRIELVIAFHVPCPIGWAVERESHRRLRRYRLAINNETEWYSLPANECVLVVGELIVSAFGEVAADRLCDVRSGAGWDRLIEESRLLKVRSASLGGAHLAPFHCSVAQS